MHAKRNGLWRSFLLGTLGSIAIACGACVQTDFPATEDGASADEVTFNRDVAPIIFANCSSCHRAGESAPFDLLTFEDARRRARQIVDVTRRRFMPPWLPQQGHDEFANARRLTDREIKTLATWAETGAARGDESDLPATPKFADGWQLGPPDLVLESPPYVLIGEGGDQFRNFVVPINIDSPKWVVSIELRPTNPRVTHHARLGVDRSYESVRRDAEDDEPGYEGMAWGQDPDGQLVIWAPGMLASRGAPGAAWRLYPKTCLVLHTHMQPSGKTETVQFRVGIHFADAPPQQRPAMLRIGGRDIDIPPGDAHHVVADEYVLPIDLELHSIFPHAHSLCRDVRLLAELPDGSRKSLIWIKDFDENWHDNYRYLKPVRLPRGTRLVSTFTYDNTDENIRNRHHPPRRVVYGSNVADEMADIYMQVTPVRTDERAVLMEDYERQELRSQLVGFRNTLSMYPQDPWSREGSAACHLALGNPDEAIRLLDERLALSPTAVHTVVELGMACIVGGDHARAEQLHRHAISMDADFPLAWLGLGRSLDAQNENQAAEEAYRQAIELAPALTDAHLCLADNLVRQGELDDAAVACEAAITTSPDVANSYLKLAEILARQRRFDDSLRHLETAQRLAPYIHPPKVLLAVYCFQSGEAERARTLLREAHAELPDHPVPELFLGQFALQDQRWEEARKFLAGAASCALPDNWPDSHKRRFLVLLHSARFKLAKQLQDVESTRDSLSNWLKYEPDNRQLREMYESLPSADAK